MSLNARKCEWISQVHSSDLEEPYDIDFNHVSDGFKLLGAVISLRDEIESDAVNTRTTGKHTIFFRRLQKCPPSPQAMSILSRCGVPKMNYTLRTHAPRVTEAAASWFDRKVIDSCACFAQLARVPSISKVLCALPCKMGGLGLTPSCDIADVAYQSSRCAALGIEGCQSQATLTAPLYQKWKTHFTEIAPQADKKILAAHLEACSEKNTAKAFLDAERRCPPDVFAASLRFRMSAPASDCPAEMPCPGCHCLLTSIAWLHHVGSCVRLKGDNASTRHASLKKAVKRICDAANIICDDAEPRDIGTANCPCGALVKYAEADSHKLVCSSARRGLHFSGPDLRIQRDEKREAIDVTVVVRPIQRHINQKPTL